MKIKLLTVDSTLPKWRSLNRKRYEILKALNAGENANFEALDIEVINGVTPLIGVDRKGYRLISHRWLDNLFEPHFSQGYDFVGLHFTRKKWVNVGLSQSLRGANPVDSDQIGEFYMWADEKTKRRYSKKSRALNQFIQVLLHEIAHEYYRGSGQRDVTHNHHYSEGEIRDLVATFDWSLYRPDLQLRRQRENMIEALLRKVITLLTKQVEVLEEQIKRKPPSRTTPLVQRKADAVVTEMARRGHPVRLVEGYRSFERQTELYNQGRTNDLPIVTNAKAGESYHNYGVAVDFVFRREGYNASDSLWQLLGEVGKRQGFEWGGDWTGFVDRPHFQLRQGYTMRDFQQGLVDYSKFN